MSALKWDRVHQEELSRRADPGAERRNDRITSRGLSRAQVEATKVLDRYRGTNTYMLGLQRQMRSGRYFMPSKKQARAVLEITREEGDAQVTPELSSPWSRWP